MKYKYKVVSATNKSAVLYYQNKYCLEYEIGEITEAIEGTLGIMVFDTVADAVNFMNMVLCSSRYKILRVIPKGRGKRPKEIARSIGTWDLEGFYYRYMNSDDPTLVWSVTAPPLGTICYPAVLVHSEVKNW